MGLVLPDDRYVTLDIRLVSSRNELRSAVSRNIQRIGRKGSGYLAMFECEPMLVDEAGDWSDIESETETVVAQIIQPHVEVGNPGVPRVNGSGQAGSQIIMDGLIPGYVIRKRQPITHVASDGVRRLYMSAAAVTANGLGQATVPLRTMLTAQPANNDVLKMAAPQIEGFATVDESSWLIDSNGYIRLRFSVEEPG